MRTFVAICATVLFTAGDAVTGLADDAPQYAPGAWHFRSVSCVRTKITHVTPRLEVAHPPPYGAADFASGVTVTYATTLGLGPIFPGQHATIVHYSGDPGNGAMQAEHAGDGVQVCFLGGPAPTTVPACDPDTNPAGRLYRVWDYVQHKQYAGSNTEHMCGGA